MDETRQVGRLADGAVVESVLHCHDSRSDHGYRLVGGAADGREFASLHDLAAYVERQRA